MTQIDEIDREDDLALLLFHHANEVDGITKLQKLIFLIQEETEFTEVHEKIEFEFESYKYGPFSEEIYDRIRFLIAIGAIEAVDTDSDTDHVRTQDDQNDLSGKKFVLTEKGKKISYEFNEILDDNIEEEIEAISNEYNDLTLNELLEYVYTQYPNYTDESEILEEVLE